MLRKMYALQGYSLASLLYGAMCFALYFKEYGVVNLFFMFATAVLVFVYIFAGNYENSLELAQRIACFLILTAIIYFILKENLFLIYGMIGIEIAVGTFICSITANYYQKKKAQSK